MSMKSLRFPWFLVLALCVAAPIWPQASTGTVRGAVRDQSDAAIAGATVILTNTVTNVASRTKTNEVGFYLFPGVNPGPYNLTIQAAGMQKFEGAVVVQVQKDAVVDAVLQVGQTTVEVAVQDSGTGIEKTVLDHIFDPFYTTKADGLGMGLAIVRTIVEAHGGRVRAANNPEGGATFSFTLPVATEQP